MLVRCPICTQDAPAGGSHPCNPTETWRQTMLQLDRYRVALERIRGTYAEEGGRAYKIANEALDY